MVVTPSELVALALRRHMEPWNWSFQCAALCLFCLTLLFHSYLLLAAALILLGTGFFRLGLDDPPDNRWFQFVRRALEWEKNWIAAPWNWYKIRRFGFALTVAAITVWALWTSESAAIGLIVGFAVLARVVAENRGKGIDP